MLIVFFVLLSLVWITLQTTPVQNWLIKQATDRLSADLRTEVSIRHVDFSLFNRFYLEGMMVKDQRKDTLLYAGRLSVRITDWFFLKNKAEIHYIGLENARINMQRSDSVWNYQFLADYFGGGKSTKNKKQIALSLQSLEMENVSLIMKDQWRGRDDAISFSSFQLKGHPIRFNDKKIIIDEIRLIDPVYASLDYTGNRPDSLIPKTLPPVAGILQWNPDSLELEVKNIILKNGTVKIDRADGRNPYPWFDGHHILFSGITGTLRNTKLLHDTLFSQIKLATRERCGFEVKQLSSSAKIHPEAMIFDQLDIITPKSHLRNYYAMYYSNFNDDMADYISKVIMEGRFEESEIDSDDIAFFAPELSTWKKKIKLSGRAKGPVENLNAKNCKVEAGRYTHLFGDITLNGLPDIDKTYIDFKANDLQTNYTDLVTFLPFIKKVKTPNLPSLGTIRYKGNLTGFLTDFVSTGTLQTSIGDIQTDLNIKMPSQKAVVYTGKINTNRFNLGRFLGISQLGNLSVDISVKGSGLKQKTLHADVEFLGRELSFNNYTYRNFSAKGLLKDDGFTGHLTSKDSNAVFDLDGTIHYGTRNPFFKFQANANNINLQALGFARENVRATGQLDVNFTGLTLDQFLGRAKAIDFTLYRDSSNYHFDSLILSSAITDNEKLLQLQSRDLNASIEGNFKISDIAADVQQLLHNYYPAYISIPANKTGRDRFRFTLNTRNTEELLPIIDPYMSGLYRTNITGSVDLEKKIFTLNADIPYFKYKELELISTKMDGKGNNDTLLLNTTARQLIYQDSLRFPDLNLSVTASHDTSIIKLQTVNNPTFRTIDLNARMYTFSNGLKLKLLPGSFDLFEKKWFLEKDGEVDLVDNVMHMSKLRFTQGEKFVELNTQPSAEDKHNDVLIDFNKINIGEIVNIFSREPKLEGLSSGRLRISDPFHHARIKTEGVVTESFKLNEDSIGKVYTDAEYDFKTNIARYKVSSSNPGNQFNLEGTYDGNAPEQQLVAEITVNNASLDAIRRYLSSFMSDVRGNIAGKLKMFGKPGDLRFNGRVNLTDASFLVDYTQCRYSIKNASLLFNDEGIDFGTIEIKDTLGNTGIVQGKLFHRNFESFSFNFFLNSSRLLMLNTTAKNNKDFYGRVIGSARMSLTGPQNDINMTVSGTAVDSSDIFIPTGNTRESGLGNDIIFKQYGRELKAQLGNGGTNITVDLDLFANELTKMHVIIGDIIMAQGSGNLKIRAGTSEPLNIRGRYNITSGSYTYNLQNLIEKPFILSPNSSSYIEWNGDPYDANMIIRAKYTAEKVRFSDLLANTNVSLNDNSLKNYIGNVDIYAIIKGNLQKPDIDFEITFPQNSDISRDPVVNSLLNQLKNDKNELTKQVSMLLVFNQFAALSQEINTNVNVWNVGINSISNLVLNEINLIFNKALTRALRSTDWNFNIGTNFYSSFLNNQSGLPDRTQFNFKVARNLINNRIVITIESDFDFRIGQGTAGNSGGGFQSRDFVFLPNITIEYKITTDGKLRATVFFRNNLDYISPDRRNRAGIGLVYKEEADTYSRLRKKKRKGNEQKAKTEKPILQSEQTGSITN